MVQCREDGARVFLAVGKKATVPSCDNQNSVKIQEKKYYKNVVVRVEKYMNRLSKEVKESSSLEILKIQLDKRLSKASICMLETAVSLQAFQQGHFRILPGLCKYEAGRQTQGSQ